MYKVIFIIVLALVMLSENADSQPNLTYPLTPSEKCAHVTNGSNKQILQPNAVDWYLGTYLGDRRRGFFQWSLPDEIIPDGSTIHSARLTMHVTPFGGHNLEMEAILYSLELDLDMASADSLWHRTDWFNNQTQYHVGFTFTINHNIDTTYYAGSDFTNAIEMALSDDFFTLGFVEQREVTHQYPFRAVGEDVKLEINFTPPPQQVLVDQKRSDITTSIGTVGRWEGGPDFIPYSVPHLFTFFIGTQEVLQGMQTLVENPYEKYHQWEGFDDVTNHHVFDVTPDLTELTSQFEKTYQTITLRNQLLSAPGSDGGTIQFRDPWLIDSTDANYGNNPLNRGMEAVFRTQSSPFNPDYTTAHNGYVYQGVFLNQEIAPNKPYYSVRAPQEQVIPFHGQDITWYFKGWSGSDVDFEHPNDNQTPVVFKEPDAVATAKYKGHLAANSDTATAFNNGRRMGTFLSNVHLVYQENNHIYYTKTVSDEENWTDEWSVDYLYPGTNPSIYVENTLQAKNPGTIGVVWDTENANGKHQPVIRYRYPNEGWYPEFKIENKGDRNTQPVVVRKIMNVFPRFFVLFRNDTTLQLSELHLGIDPWSEEKTVPATTPHSLNPCMDGSDYNPSTPDRLYICWEDSGQIYYSTYNGLSFSNPQIISGDLLGAGGHNPSLSYNGEDVVHIAWQSFDGETGYRLNHKKITLNDERDMEPINQVSVWDMNLTRPSIGSYLGSSEAITAMQSGENHVNYFYYNGQEWSIMEAVEEGGHPNLTTSGSTLWSVWTDHTKGLPYLIKPMPVAPSQRENVTDYQRKYYRRQMFELSTLPVSGLKGKVSLSVGDIKIYRPTGVENWPFVEVSDSLKPGDFQKTVPLTIGQDMQKLVLDYGIQVTGLVKPPVLLHVPLFSIRVLNPNAQPVATLHRLPFSAISGPHFELKDTLVVNLQAFSGQRIQLHLQSIINHYQSSGATAQFMNVFEFYPGNPVKKKNLSLQNEIPDIPHSFKLYPNYPNPFNPVTTITYDLPEASRVNLVVYDVTGRRIRTLVNGNFPAGTHQAVWDGTRQLPGS